MVRKLIAILVLLVLLAGAAGAYYIYSLAGEIENQRVAGDVHVLYGLGGNVGMVNTALGPVIVDSMTFALQGRRIREQAIALAGGEVQAVINTHYHGDHTHGNPGFKAGTKVVSTMRTREHLLQRDADYWDGDAAAFLPNEIFDQQHTLEIGGKTIRSYYFGRGHTDGDLVVQFVEDRVVHLGDLFFNGHYPNIDLEAGGSVREWADTLDRVLELEFDRVIPGHGMVTDREGIMRFQRFLRQLWQIAERAAAEGLTLSETQRTTELTEDAGYEEIYVPLLIDLDRDFVLRRAWEEATAKQ
ncbi:MAG TPA: MBL fold metallo-hydrolase [Terriglobales bacterium]|nr:MBL fold metallo-hydrolase [Terriglobales bacterium]